MSKRFGKVYLVGAGPGDPDLITRKGAALLRKADCVIYDRLVGPDLLKETKAGCERLYVGKGSDEGGISQSRINRLLVKQAKEHRIVVRLKGGDPTLFGRVSEEMETLHQAKIRVKIVPGVSSAWAAAALAGIPLTDRQLSSSVAIVTGKEAQGGRSKVRWERLANAVDTVVILMGRAALPDIAQRLMKGGRSSSTPVALIRWAATPRQGIWITTLGSVERDLRRHPQFGPPVVAVVGEVVRLQKRFQLKPLDQKRILVTRPATDQQSLTRRLESLGATCIHLPTIEIRPRRLPTREVAALFKKLPRYDWILFTSHHGVKTLNRLARRFKKPLSSLVKGKVCAIGPRTAEEAEADRLTVELLPREFSTEGILKAFERIPVENRRILIPRSNLSVRDSLAQGLRRRGALVEEVVLYETIHRSIPAGRLKQALRRIDALTFTSASTVNGFLRALEEARFPVRAAFDGAEVVAIGPATRKALKEAGISKVHLPKEAGTIDGLVATVVEVLRGQTPFEQKGSDPFWF